ncbi:LysE family translocator [Piscinibacter sp. HJYY11]|uniref:LysE family translocator n=1 Tax=Piscinibacter sp. HJYY11 TaxID=2801333 RepID=UPI00191EE6C5|nr:LysE family translocator [Piscinibacter sp. HJYY11]MBL0726905.1 LysE family translocator [Piscinibacter sp. HJYY11]
MLESLGVHNLPLFVAAGLLLNITPGADMLYVASHAASGGRRAGLLAALGIGAGCLFHVALATVGLSALLASSELAFNLVKWVGAGYLVWMGIGMLRASPGDAREAVAPDVRRVFWRGVLTNALNPKVALFFLAFLPQFMTPDAPHQALGFALLGLIFTVNGTLVTLAFGWLAGTACERLAGRLQGSQVGLWLQRAAGAMFIGLGVKLAAGSR